MSRYLRHKSNPVPAQRVVRKTSPNFDDSSGDEAYEGVDLISDSEEDEPDVEEAEEQAIIESENDYDGDSQSTPRPTIDDGQDWEAFGFELHTSAIMADSNTDLVAASSAGERRVRFDLSGDDSDTTASFDDTFPDFIDKASLDPVFRQQIDQDDGDESLSETYWELENEDGGVHLQHDVVDEESDSDTSGASSGSSGYETDEGETTEEDEELSSKKTIVPHRSFLRQVSHTLDSESSDEEETPVRRRPGRGKDGRPTLGTWSHSSNKPYAMISGSGQGGKIVMFNVKDGRYPNFASGSRSQIDLTRTNARPIIDSSPMISNSGNVMMSAMLDKNFPGFDGHAVGPLEAFYPFTTINADGTIVQDSSSGYDQSDMDDEDNINMNDFFDFGGDDTCDEDSGEGEQATDSAGASEPASTPARPTTATSEDEVHPLLAHFGSHPVTAFRNHQNRHYQMNHNGMSQESLAFGSQTIRGVKKGRLQHASIPLTPQRKHKSRQNSKSIIPDSSPLAAHQQLGRKRGFNGEEIEARGHKRNRSSL